MVILYIEDDQDSQILMGAQLKRHKHELVLASTFREALEKLEESLPDLIILDMGLPDIKGLEALSYLRGHYPTPIVVFSGQADETSVDQALSLGAVDYVVKSIGRRTVDDIEDLAFRSMLASKRLAMRKNSDIQDSINKVISVLRGKQNG